MKTYRLWSTLSAIEQWSIKRQFDGNTSTGYGWHLNSKLEWEGRQLIDLWAEQGSRDRNDGIAFM